jgi:snapalysin
VFGALTQRMTEIAEADPGAVRAKGAAISACGAEGVQVGAELAGGINRCEWTGASRDRCADLGIATNRALGSLSRIMGAIDAFLCEYAAVLEENREGARRALRLWSTSRLLGGAGLPLAWFADQLATAIDAAVTSAVAALQSNLGRCRSAMAEVLAEHGRAMRTIEADARFLGTVHAGTTFIEYDDSEASEARTEIAMAAATWNRSVKNVKLLRGGPDALLHYDMDEGYTVLVGGPRGLEELPDGAFRTSGETDDNRIAVHPGIMARARVSPTRLFTHETGHFLGLEDTYETPCANLMSGGDFTERFLSKDGLCESATPAAAEAREVDRLWALPPANLWKEGTEPEDLQDRPRFIKGLLQLRAEQ